MLVSVVAQRGENLIIAGLGGNIKNKL